MRKTLLSFDYYKAWKKDSIQKLFDASGAASFTGVANEKHLLVVVSADCCMDEARGWLGHCNGKPSHMDFFKERVKFALEIAKNRANTLGFLFDGRSRDCRRAIDAITSKHDYLAELDITFVGKFNKAATRKVFGSQLNHECCHLVFSQPRTAYKCVDRQARWAFLKY